MRLCLQRCLITFNPERAKFLLNASQCTTSRAPTETLNIGLNEERPVMFINTLLQFMVIQIRNGVVNAHLGEDCWQRFGRHTRDFHRQPFRLIELHSFDVRDCR